MNKRKVISIMTLLLAIALFALIVWAGKNPADQTPPPAPAESQQATNNANPPAPSEVIEYTVAVNNDIPQDWSAMQQETITIGDDTPLVVALAQTGDERTAGLSGFEALPPGSGMLFMFDMPFQPTFWMKDMLFDLDMIWINPNGIIEDISADVAASSFPDQIKPNSKNIQYVLEVPAGWSVVNGVQAGDQITGIPGVVVSEEVAVIEQT